jgi:uncharacterized repeat protein (TIGR02543 family)
MKKLVMVFLVVSVFGCKIALTAPEPTYYTIAYFGNGNNLGSAPVDTRQYEGGSSATVLGKGSLAKTSHTFLHWNASPQGSGVSYNPNEKITLTSNISLYAIWGSLYTVSFDTGGGSEIPPIANVAKGEKIGKPDDPTKPGYSFRGWYKDKQYSAVWNFTTDVVTKNTTLCAKWTNAAPGEVKITDCIYNVATNRVEISYKTPNDIDLDHLLVYVNDSIYYNDIPKTYVAIYLYEVQNGSVVTIKAVDIAGLTSNGVNCTINFSGYTPSPNIIAVIPSVDVVRKYYDRIEPSSISCTFEAHYQNGEKTTLNSLPEGWNIAYTTSSQQTDIPYTGPIVVDRSWTKVTFRL